MSFGLIKSLMTETLTVERRGPGVWVNGRYEKGSKSCHNIKASVQPMSGDETKILPEGRRSSESMKIYTYDRLFMSDESKQIAADVIKHDGKFFEIHMVQNWKIGTDLPHYKCIAVKIDDEGRGDSTRSD